MLIRAEASGSEALAALGSERFDLAVLGLELSDMRAFDLIDGAAHEPDLTDLPMLVYAPGAVAAADESRLTRLAQSLVLKDVHSPERLLDEAALFLHRPLERLPEPKRRMVEQLHQSAAVLAGKKVLVVDDDIRNISAVTAALEKCRMGIPEDGPAAPSSI